METWVYFWALCSVPLVYVTVFMPVPGCLDYRGLVIQFDIRYCDPSCFVLLSQNCCSYSGSFMVTYKFLKCLFYICETSIQKNMCPPVFIATQFTIANCCKQPKCPSVNEWTKKLWYIYTMKYYAAERRSS